MATKRILTQLAVDKAKSRGRRYDLPDGPGGVPGLMLRVSEHGARSFALRYRFGDKQPRLTLGKPPTMSLADARVKAREVLDLVEQGIDPVKRANAVAEEAEAIAEQRTVAKVVEKYVAARLKPRARRWADVEAMLQRDVVERWGPRPIAEISKRDVRDLIEGILARGAPVVANRILSHLRGLFKWTIRNDYATANPALDVDRPHNEEPRERFLSDDEIKAVWQSFERMGYPFGALGQLLLLTGARRGEWAGAAWSELDLERKLWNLPSGRSKTGAALLLPLSKKVVAILETIPRIDDSDLLFPSIRATSSAPISGFSKGLATAQKLSATKGWTWHDLRRTCRTKFAELGVTAAVGERIINHSDGTRNRIAAVYDQHSYLPEMRQALEIWSSEIDRIAAGPPPKVVPLRRLAQ
jgi:integrase